MFSLKKAFSIARENNIFSKNELILFASTTIFILATILFGNSLGLDFKEASYVSTVGFIYVILLNITGAYFAIASINKDIEGRYIYFLLKNCSRTEYIVWKAISVSWVLFLTNIIFWLVFLAGYALLVWKIDWAVAYIIPFQLLESWFLSMIAILVTLLLRNNMARIFSLILFYFVANSTYGLRVLIDQQAFSFGELGNKIYGLIYQILPNFAHFNIRDVLPYTIDVWIPLATALCYSIIWGIIILLAANVAFKNKNL